MRVEQINVDQNLEKERRIKRIVQKDQCLDIFKDAQDGADHPTKSMNHKQFMKYKFERKSRELVLNKLKIMINLKLVGGIIYVNSLLKKIELSKELLILEIQQGKEVFLGPEFNQSTLPASFRYYDSILRIVQKMLAPNRRQYYLNRN